MAERRRRRVPAVLASIAVIVTLMVYAGAGRASRGTRSGPSDEATPFSCPKVEAPEVSPPRFDPRPELDLPQGEDYSAVIKTSCGDIELDLLEAEAPQTVANFIFLAQEGFFDGLTWHRIERDFVIQTGDPDGIISNEHVGPGYTIPDELPADTREYVYGVVAMANDGPDTGGSQFFIVVHDPENKEHAGIEPEYSIFGRVSEASYETLDKIAAMPVEGGSDVFTSVQPRAPVVIETIEIRASG